MILSRMWYTKQIENYKVTFAPCMSIHRRACPVLVACPALIIPIYVDSSTVLMGVIGQKVFKMAARKEPRAGQTEVRRSQCNIVPG